MKSESRIQQEIVMWFRNKFCLRHHDPRSLIMSIPNEGKPDLVKTGLYPGASDLIVIHKGEVLFVEVKNQIGTQQPKQELFQSHVESMGYRYILVRSLEEFAKINYK